MSSVKQLFQISIKVRSFIEHNTKDKKKDQIHENKVGI
jgi:hypothetical protein